MTAAAFFDEAAVLAQVDALLGGRGDPPGKLGAVCRVLATEVSHYDWVGFYVVPRDGASGLCLGPFYGAATEHTQIPFGRGICGQVAITGETLVVPDVSQADNYLACSLDVRAEIVVPIFSGGRFIAQIDIDSHTPDPFTEADGRLLDAVCQRVVSTVEALRRGPWLCAPGGRCLAEAEQD